jgi:serine/threonine protein kinase
MVPGETMELSDEDWSRIQRSIAGFEAAWKTRARPEILDHVPADEARRDALLLELVHVDLEFRLKAGDSVRVEDYLERFPGLDRDPLAVLGLIRAEWSVRGRTEPDVGLEHYLDRFPAFRDELTDPGPGESSSLFESNPRPPDPAETAADTVGLSPGDVLEQYEIRARVGEGAFGVVFRAWDRTRQREVALKVARPEALRSEEDIRFFLREARHGALPKHPNVVEVLDAGMVAGKVCLSREFIDGESLADRIRRAPIAPVEAARISYEIADALAHAHQQGVIHRDLKPSNILIDGQGRAHVADFGLARREGGDTSLTTAAQPSPLIGTYAYMSPEQALGQSRLVGPRTDLYSAGVVLYEMLTGRIPYTGRSGEILDQIVAGNPRPPRRIAPEIPRELESICLKCMATDPNHRFGSAVELLGRLKLFLERQASKPTQGWLARWWTGLLGR